MDDNERAAALAQAIENGWKPGAEKPFIPFYDEVLIAAALRAFSPPPADVREAVRNAILKAADNLCLHMGGEDPEHIADAALAALQAAGWGPRDTSEVEKLRADLKRFKDEREYIVGFNDGFEEAQSQYKSGDMT